jgi:hypothetical protein
VLRALAPLGRCFRTATRCPAMALVDSTEDDGHDGGAVVDLELIAQA